MWNKRKTCCMILSFNAKTNLSRRPKVDKPCFVVVFQCNFQRFSTCETFYLGFSPSLSWHVCFSEVCVAHTTQKCEGPIAQQIVPQTCSWWPRCRPIWSPPQQMRHCHIPSTGIGWRSEWRSLSQHTSQNRGRSQFAKASGDSAPQFGEGLVVVVVLQTRTISRTRWFQGKAISMATRWQDYRRGRKMGKYCCKNIVKKVNSW